MLATLGCNGSTQTFSLSRLVLWNVHGSAPFKMKPENPEYSKPGSRPYWNDGW